MASLYMYNALRGNKNEETTDKDYYYLSRLLNFRNEYNLGQIKDEDFSEKLLDVLRNHPIFDKTTRACIAIAYPLSNKIGIVSSATTKAKNLMGANYSCYVSRTSSLNSIEKGSVRVYDDIDIIVDEFIEQNKPVQKSLHYLKKMGVRSGLTIKLETRALKGYLFLNSDDVGYYSEIEKKCSTYLNLLEMIVSEYFNKKMEDFYSVSNIETYLHKFPSSKLLSNAHLYGKDGIKEISNFISYYMEGDVSLKIQDNTNKKFLVPWGQISLITSMLLRELGYLKGIPLDVEIYDDENTMKISLSSSEFSGRADELSFDHYRGIRKFARNLGIELIKQKDNFLFSLEVDYNQKYADITYSTFEDSSD